MIVRDKILSRDNDEIDLDFFEGNILDVIGKLTNLLRDIKDKHPEYSLFSIEIENNYDEGIDIFVYGSREETEQEKHDREIREKIKADKEFHESKRMRQARYSDYVKLRQEFGSKSPEQIDAYIEGNLPYEAKK